MTAPRWYMLNKMGMATLCTDKEEAEQEAADAQMAWPHMGPHRAVQLVEAADVEALRASHGQEPQQEPSYTSAQLAEMVLSDCGHSSNYTPLLNRVAARIDAHVERCLESKKTPQQEAQEPVAWYVTGCGRLLDEDEAKAEARHIGGTARAIPVYTAPQPSPAAQGDALDAARYRYLRDGDWRENDKLEPIIRLQLNSLWDAAIDAARKEKS